MLFICNPKLRKLEAFMQEVPGFPPKGMKIDLDKLKDEIVLFKIESVFFSPKNIERKEKEKNMKFRNDQHRSAFLKEVKNQSLSNHKLLAVLYLLTAEASLWNSTKDFVKEDEAKLIGMEGNRRFIEGIVAGPFFICGNNGEDFCSLPDELCEKYVREFAQLHEISQDEVQRDTGMTFISF